MQVQRNKNAAEGCAFGSLLRRHVLHLEMKQARPLGMDTDIIVVSLMVALIAGIVKGTVGFGMPTLMISGMGAIVAPELALAGLILPTLFSNGMQAFRQGSRAAWQTIRKFKVFLCVGFVLLVASAQWVTVLPAGVLLLTIGLVVGFTTVIQLLGFEFHVKKPGGWSEVAIGAIAGFTGGLSGIWGPPTILYLTALRTEKAEQIRAQGVIYGLGAVALTGSHVVSGVLNYTTVWYSLALVPPAVIGMWLGGKLSDKIPQAAFRRLTLLLLMAAAINLIRKGLIA